MCHSGFPKLNPFGEAFAKNGYQMPGGDVTAPSQSFGDPKLHLENYLNLAVRVDSFFRYRTDTSALIHRRHFDLTALGVLCYPLSRDIPHLDQTFCRRAVMAEEQRASKRVPFIRDIEIVGVGWRRTTDLSIGGMYIETVADFQNGTELDLRFRLTDADSEEIRVRARVLYVHPGIGAGISFLNLSPQNQEKIQAWIDRQ